MKRKSIPRSAVYSLTALVLVFVAARPAAAVGRSQAHIGSWQRGFPVDSLDSSDIPQQVVAQPAAQVFEIILDPPQPPALVNEACTAVPVRPPIRRLKLPPPGNEPFPSL